VDKLRALHYFVAAADAGSLTAAARSLGISVPAVQKLVTALERALGVKLFNRSRQGLQLTASGQGYLESCRPVLAELAMMDEAVSRSTHRPSGTLVVGLHAQLAHHLILPALPEFHRLYPEIQIDLRVINRVTDADAESVDVFLLHGWPEAQDLVHRRLGHAQTFIAASPAYWQVHGVPLHPTDLEKHVCLVMRNPAGILIDLWDFARGAEQVSVPVNGWLCTNGREVLLHAVLTGEGVGRFTELTTREHVAAGRLVPVLQDWKVEGGPPVNLLYRPSQRRTPRVRLFVDFVASLLNVREADGRQRFFPDRPLWHRRGMGRASSILRTRR
jgi:LysR family transcriptional regulator for bpeEF and oprC